MKLRVMTHNLYIFLHLTATCGCKEARTNSDWPVPPVSGFTDEDADNVPTLFHTLHQT